MHEYDEIKWMINTSVGDGRHTIIKCKDVAVLKEALAREQADMKRRTMIKMLEVRIRQVERAKSLCGVA